MEIRGWPKILALVVASAFGGALAFGACLVTFFSHFATGTRSLEATNTGVTVHGVPPITERVRFLGTMGQYNGDFDPRNSDKVLDAGPGQIVGSITAGGKPIAGVRIQLALNGSVMSQPGESAADGRYRIAVPYGAYRIDGYRLDYQRLDGLLGGKTDNPKNRSSARQSPPIQVAEGKPAAGLDLDYIEPVRITGPSGEVSLTKPIVVSWKAYPGAASYRIELTEFKTRGDFINGQAAFRWPDRPEVLDTSIDLKQSRAQLHAGSYYRVDVEALDPSMAVIATTGNRFGSMDFRVVD
jgi:hypothetical protein